MAQNAYDPSGKTATSPLGDRLFEGGCTALFLVLIGCVMSAVWVYDH
jgi:hypothetical protein